MKMLISYFFALLLLPSLVFSVHDSPVFNVLDYGAVGDGLADSTNVFNYPLIDELRVNGLFISGLSTFFMQILYRLSTKHGKQHARHRHLLQLCTFPLAIRS